MLVHVPQGCVALVYVGSELRGVLEAGLNCVTPFEGMALHYVALHAAAESPEDTEVLGALH